MNIMTADLVTCYSNVKNIPMQSFRWIATSNDVRAAFIAQDIQKVIPDAVKEIAYGGLSDCLTINTDHLFNDLFGCVKIMQKQIEALQTKVDGIYLLNK